jgi:hypothetical protein
MSAEGRGELAKIHVIFRCPFCSGKVEAGFAENGDGVVFHDLPPCKMFVDLRPDEFMAAVNKRMRS